MAGDLASLIFNFASFFAVFMSEYTLKSLLKRIYHVLDFKKSRASML